MSGILCEDFLRKGLTDKGSERWININDVFNDSTDAKRLTGTVT